MAVVSMKQLLEAGVHFGHQTRRWNPKMATYIYTERNGIYIVDLQKTVKKLEEAYAFVRQLSESGQSLLFVGTKKQAQEAIKEEATRCGQYYGAERNENVLILTESHVAVHHRRNTDGSQLLDFAVVLSLHVLAEVGI